MESNHKSARWILSACTISAYPGLIGEEDLLWPEILKRLAVEILCRFRCVCKSWNSLLSSSFFINLHHSFHSQTSTPRNLKPYLRLNLADLRHDSYALYHPRAEEHDVRQHVHFPFELRDDSYTHALNFVSLVNGLICISYSLDSSFDSTILWNPAIRKYLPLPFLPFHVDLEQAKVDAHFPAAQADFLDHAARFVHNAIGFGYDSCTNAFKVVRIWIPSTCMVSVRISPPPSCEVYSTRQGLWRGVPITRTNLFESWQLNFDTRRNRMGCFVNGTVHWMLSSVGFATHCVLMFDCEREEFTTAELPKEIYLVEPGWALQRMRPIIFEYADMLAVVMHSKRGPWHIELSVDMWVMEEHGVSTSWTKLYRVLDPGLGSPDSINITTYQLSSNLELPPYGPTRWIKHITPGERETRFLRDNVYEESLFLLDDHNATSYTNKIVPIFVPLEFKKHSTGKFSGPCVQKEKSLV